MATLVELKEEEVASIMNILLAEHGDEMDYEIENSNQVGIRIEKIERSLGIGVLLMCLCLMGCEPPVMAEVTGYCDKECCCGVWAKKGVNAANERVTSSQHVIRPGDKFIAAPKHIPFGTMITVPGYGRFPVEDRGGAIVGNCIDLYFCDKDGISGHQRALNFGRQQLLVIIEREKQ